MVTQIQTAVLVVGGGTGGTAAAIQSARRGVKTLLVTETDWLGGMLTSAGVTAPDGNELAAWQTGLWGQFLRQLKRRQVGGLDHGWVSLFTYLPQTGAQILADWVQALPALTWISHQTPVAVLKHGDRLVGVRFPDYEIRADITLDGTELGDLLALGDIDHRWGWDWPQTTDSDGDQEPSAPVVPNAMTATYPVQSPTWVFVLRRSAKAQAISPLDNLPSAFDLPWQQHRKADFLSYGQLPQQHYMINWPIAGNDYGQNLNRLLGSPSEQRAFLQEAYDHSWAFAHFLQQNHFPDLELATGIFPAQHRLPTASAAFALHPYYRESRRLVGIVTLTEPMILPRGRVAPLPYGEDQITSIIVGNYANDHHYPGYEFPLAPKSLQWGGRWTGTPFTIPYQALLPKTVRGFLPCEKNISVSHIANGSSRLQPVVMNTGQAAGMAAALCIENGCDPHDLPVRELQLALIGDRQAPAAVIPCFNLSWDHPEWKTWQRYYLDHPEAYPEQGECDADPGLARLAVGNCAIQRSGTFHRLDKESYQFQTPDGGTPWQLITERPDVALCLQDLPDGEAVTVGGRLNPAGNWFIAEALER